MKMCLEKHREALESFWHENTNDPRIAVAISERLRWLYERNPDGATRTWLGFSPSPDSRIIGCGSLISRRMALGGRRYLGGNLADFAVDKAHRLAGPAIMIQRAIVRGSKEAGFDLVYGWPNDKSVGVCKRVGYTSIGMATRWVKPLHTEKKLREALKNPLIRKAAAAGVDRVLMANDWRKILSRLVAFRSETLLRADERFDALWARMRLPYLVGEKTAAYLNWRYADYTTKRIRFFCVTGRLSQRLLGYAVYSVRGDVASVEDLLVDDLNEHLDVLLLGLALKVRDEGACSLSLTYLGTDKLFPRLRSLGFFDRGGDRPLIVYLDKDPPEELMKAAFDSKQWFIFDGELDI